MGDRLRIHVEPLLRRSPLVLAFGGWNDAGEAATSALGFLQNATRAVPLADIDPEEFYDFTVQRPEIRLGEGGARNLLWPGFEFRYGSIDTARELVTGVGNEPNLRWTAFSDCVVRLCEELGLDQVILLGAYLADVVHSLPVQVTGFGTDAEALKAVGVVESSYEGPTGIAGVLGDRLAREGASVVSLWAGLPHYVDSAPNPRGSLALLQKLAAYLGVAIDDSRLRSDAAAFEHRVAQAVAEDPDLSAYVEQLGRRELAQ